MFHQDFTVKRQFTYLAPGGTNIKTSNTALDGTCCNVGLKDYFFLQYMDLCVPLQIILIHKLYKKHIQCHFYQLCIKVLYSIQAIVCKPWEQKFYYYSFLEGYFLYFHLMCPWQKLELKWHLSQPLKNYLNQLGICTSHPFQVGN